MTVYYITILAVALTSWMAQYFYKMEFDADGQNVVKYHKNLLYVILTAAILIFVAGFRWKVGTDYTSYVRNYGNYIAGFWDDLLSLNEPGIKIIAIVSSWIYNDYATMFFVASLFTIGLSVMTISKYSDMFGFSILLFIFTGCWQGSFNGIRQFLAGAILFAGYRYIIDRRFIKYLLIVLIASAVHFSAILMIAIYFITMRRIDLKQILLFAFIGIVLYFSYDLIFGFIENIKGEAVPMMTYMTKKVNLLRIAVAFAPVLLFFIIRTKVELTSEDTFYINVLLINAVFMLATSNSAYLARIGIYTNFFTVLALPRLITFYGERNARIFKIIAIIFYVIFWYIEVSGSYSLNKFQWIFNRV